MSTAAGYFTARTTSGSGYTWTDTINLMSGGLAATSTASWIYQVTNTVKLSIPDYISAIDGGSFQSLKVAFAAKYANVQGSPKSKIKLTDGTTTFEVAPTDAYATYSQEGDASYWGISGTPQEIFDRLKSGALKWEYFSYASNYNVCYLKDVVVTLTYTQPDTKRASMIVTFQ